MSFNEIIFLKRSVLEKIHEDKEVLYIYYDHLKQLITIKKHYNIIARFYSKKLEGMLNLIGEALENIENVERFFEECNYYDLKLIHDTIYWLIVFCMHLDRAFRHRNPLFDSKVKIYAPHYAFEPLYKTLLSSDAILYESIDRSVFSRELFLLSYFGERGPATPVRFMLLPYHLYEQGLIEKCKYYSYQFCDYSASHALTFPLYNS